MRHLILIIKEDLENFRNQYNKALENKEDTFIYKNKLFKDGKGEFVTNFAKYLIEYIESKK